jgi:bacteriocin-like protein
MQGKDNVVRPKLPKKLTLNKETVRVLTDKELAGIEGGVAPTRLCSGDTCACGGTCGNRLSTCPIG